MKEIKTLKTNIIILVMIGATFVSAPIISRVLCNQETMKNFERIWTVDPRNPLAFATVVLCLHSLKLINKIDKNQSIRQEENGNTKSHD